jgi:hypothetical protein
MARAQRDRGPSFKKGFGYFLMLIETAIGYYNQEGYDIGAVH